MSRSYKKTPIYKDGYGCKTKKWYKRQSSKAVRRYEKRINDGSEFKKIYCSWFISDYRFFKPWDKIEERNLTKVSWSKIYLYK